MIELYKPDVEDLWFRQKMLSDGETMSYNHAWGGTIMFPEEKWADWHDRWVCNHEDKRFYRYIMENGIFVGEVAYHLDEERQIYIADVIVFVPYRSRGYGRQALLLLCDIARENGVQTLYDDIAIDNPSIALFADCGFMQVMQTDEYVLVKKEL